jgi:ATP-dependent Lon protease
VKKQLEIVPVVTVDEVLRLALERMPEPIPAEPEPVAVAPPAVPAAPATEPAVRPLN